MNQNTVRKILLPFVKPILNHVYWKIDITICKVPIHISPPHIWWGTLWMPGERTGRFKKRPRPDIYNPKRWGGYVLGLEIGCRG